MQLEIRNLNKSYGQKQVLFDVNFTASSSNTLGLLGRNGHGKSTTMKIIMGIIYEDSGEVLLDGSPLSRTSVKLGYLPEERGLYQKINILDQMVYFGTLRGMAGPKAKKAATDLLERLEMTEYLKKNAITLSKGNQQKIQLAIALMNDPDIIILDEPFSGLDPVNSRIMQEIIEEASRRSKLIIFSSHQMSQVEEFCRDICIIKEGRVMLTGSLGNIKESYPKNRLSLVPEPGCREDLLSIITNHLLVFITSYTEENGAFILHLKKEEFKNQIIQLLAEKSAKVNAISVVQPTLLQIFLEKVGDDIV